MDESCTTEYLSKINALLSKIKVPITLLSLKECVPSLWIAVFEGLLETRIPEIDRSFNLSDESRTRNLEAVLSQLKNLFKIDLGEISPADLISYNESAICYLINVFTKIAESIDDYKQNPALSDLGQDKESFKKRKRSIYNGNKLQSTVKDDISNYIKESNRASLESIQFNTPIKEKATALLQVEKKDTPHMKALKLKRMDLMKAIASAKDNSSISMKIQKTKESNIDRVIEKEIKKIYSRPRSGPLSDIQKVEKQVVVTKEYKTKPEKNLDIFEGRVRKSMPTLDTFPTKQTKDEIHDQQMKTWTRALDDRLWTRRLNSHLNYQMISDTRIIDQAKKEIDKTREIEQRKKESAALKSIKADLNERVRRAIRMDHRRQVVHDEVENLKLKRRFREEQAVKGLLDHYVKAERQMIIEERRFEKDKKKAQEEKLRQQHESKMNYYRDQIKLLKEQYEETKKEDEIMEKARKEEYRKLVREKKEEAKKKVKMVKEKLEVDVSNLGFQEATAHRLRSSLKFAFR